MLIKASTFIALSMSPSVSSSTINSEINRRIITGLNLDIVRCVKFFLGHRICYRVSQCS